MGHRSTENHVRLLILRRDNCLYDLEVFVMALGVMIP